MINKKEKKNKKAMTQLKAYFLIINVIVAILPAFAESHGLCLWMNAKMVSAVALA